jgi:MFS family permease
MAGFISFPALQPEFQRLWTLSDSEAEFISGIYFAGYVIAVPLVSGLTDRLVSAALWRFVQGGGVRRLLYAGAADVERSRAGAAAGNGNRRLYRELHRAHHAELARSKRHFGFGTKNCHSP